MPEITIKTSLWKWLRAGLIGRRLSAAIARHEAAADNLDAALRELWKE